MSGGLGVMRRVLMSKVVLGQMRSMCINTCKILWMNYVTASFQTNLITINGLGLRWYEGSWGQWSSEVNLYKYFKSYGIWKSLLEHLNSVIITMINGWGTAGDVKSLEVKCHLGVKWGQFLYLLKIRWMTFENYINEWHLKITASIQTKLDFSSIAKPGETCGSRTTLFL